MKNSTVEHLVKKDPRDTKVEKICKNPECLEIFRVRKHRDNTAHYCSRACYHICKAVSSKRVCAVCKEEYETSKALRKTASPAGKKYCSTACRDVGRTKRIEKVCESCNKTFIVKRYRAETAHCCSVACGAVRRARLLATGEMDNPYSRGRKGRYTSKVSGLVERFDSSWEKLRMTQLDLLGLTWTKKHGIVIPYTDHEGVCRRYIPDFRIESADGVMIEEVKPSDFLDDRDVLIKTSTARGYCAALGWAFRIVTEVDLGIKPNKEHKFDE